MSRHRYRAVKKELEELISQTALPTDQPAAVYYRQSTWTQVGNVSTAIQTIDMVQLLVNHGWKEGDIRLIDMDAGVSGTTKIDERQGMRELFQAITDKQIRAVATQDEDRLFRDVTQIQVNIFIEACRASHVIVITPSMIYNFADSQLGDFHARQFRFKSEMAAEYIKSYIKGKLHPAKRRLMMEGRWAGPPMPVGYMADMRKTLPSGASNPHWRKYVIYEPYAEVVREYWRLFLHYGGQIRPTVRHIVDHGPYYPDPKAYPAPEGFKAVYRIRQNQGKQCPGRMGLQMMLTNATYLGHWMVNGQIVIWDNHPPLLEEGTFMRAFNYRSDVLFDGSPNPYYRPVVTYAQPSVEKDRSAERPLCAGLLHAQDTGDNWLVVGTRWSKSNNHYYFEHYSRRDDKSIWNMKASLIDEAVVERLLTKLEATYNFQAWEEALEVSAREFREIQASKQAQLAQAQSVMDNLIASLAVLTSTPMIQAAEKRYLEAEKEFNRLKVELAAESEEAERLKQIKQLRETCAEVFTVWPNMSIEEQRQIVHGFVERIEIESMDVFCNLTVHWKDGSSEAFDVRRYSGDGMRWTEEEIDRLLEWMESDATQLEVATQFPERTWGAMEQQYMQNRRKKGRNRPYRKRMLQPNESFNDYEKRVAEAKPLADMTDEDHH